VDWAAQRRHLIEGDGSEGLLVLGDVVSEDVEERLGLLGAEIDALEVANVDLVGRVLRESAEDEEEVPDGHTDLHAVSVAIAVVGGGGEVEPWLLGRGFLLLAHEVAFEMRLVRKGVPRDLLGSREAWNQ
jgi:hypothetical protein